MYFTLLSSNTCIHVYFRKHLFELLFFDGSVTTGNCFSSESGSMGSLILCILQTSLEEKNTKPGVPNLFVPVPQNTTWRHSNSPLAFIVRNPKIQRLSVIFNTHEVMHRPRYLRLVNAHRKSASTLESLFNFTI